MRRHPLILALSVVLGPSCGGRTVSLPLPVGQDAGSDATVRPDAGRDAGSDAAIGGCLPPGAPVTLVSEGAPALAYSLSALDEGGYVAAAGVGWSQDLRARLLALDGDTLAVESSVDLQGEMAFAGDDPDLGYVVVADVEDGGRTTLRWLTRPGTSTPLQELHSYLLCEGCTAFFSSPASGAERSAVAVEMGDAHVMVVIARLGWDEVTVSTTSALPGAMPQVVPTPDGWLLVYLADQQVMAVAYDLDGYARYEPRPVALPGAPPVHGLSATGSLGLEGAHLAAFVEDDAPRDLVIATIDWEAAVLRSSTVPAAVSYDYQSSVVEREGLVGVAWGVNSGGGEVGAHFAAFRASDLSLRFGPLRVSPAIQHASSTYMVWAMVAPHPEGFALVWGGWHEDTNYGLYGLRLTCANEPGR